VNAEKTTYNGLDAVRIENDKGDVLVVVTGIGPRITCFLPEGRENIFYVDDEETGPRSAGDSKWHLYGGTRLWISPEAETSYSPDNSPCDVTIEDRKVTVISPVDKTTKLRKLLKIEARSKSFDVTYTIKNEGTHLFTAGLWAITCMKPLDESAIYLPWGETSRWNIKDIKYWRSWLGSNTNVASGQWNPTDEFFIVKPTGETGKVGFANRCGYAVYRAGQTSFIKKSDYIPTANYPDDGCSCEVYTCEKFYEIETLSPLFVMKPDETCSHSEKWWAGFEKIDTNTVQSVNAFVEKVLS